VKGSENMTEETKRLIEQDNMICNQLNELAQRSNELLTQREELLKQLFSDERLEELRQLTETTNKLIKELET